MIPPLKFPGNDLISLDGTQIEITNNIKNNQCMEFGEIEISYKSEKRR